MEGTTCERTGTLAPAKAPLRMLGGGSAPHQRSVRDRDRQDWGSWGRQSKEGNWVGGLVSGLSWRASRGFEEGRSGLSRVARGEGVDCRGIRSGGGGCGGCGRRRRGGKR